ncbi:MAG: methyltransferase domain-containing protein [Pseudonocardiales bacterium]|nr:methyltransferase domain-containing protein [Pseudonocardiales bacterium]
MEIGTGTGLTGALLAELVGPDGHVVSIDIDSVLTQRAATLHSERGVTNLALLTRDGHLGAAEHGPYDVILSWATPTHVPQSWIGQAKPWAVISTPVYVAEVARCVGHLRAVVTDEGELDEPRLGKAGYVDMGEEINTSRTALPGLAGLPRLLRRPRRYPPSLQPHRLRHRWLHLGIGDRVL